MYTIWAEKHPWHEWFEKTSNIEKFLFRYNDKDKLIITRQIFEKVKLY